MFQHRCQLPTSQRVIIEGLFKNMPLCFWILIFLSHKEWNDETAKYNLRKFGLQTIRHRCPSALDSWLFLRFRCRDLPALTSLKRYVSRGLWRVPAARSHLKRFCLKIVLSFRSGAHVFSRPRFFSSGSALGALGCKSLQVYSMFCVVLSKTTVKAN